VLYIDGETQEMEAQATFIVPSHADHNFDAKGDKPTVLIEAFAPPREDYIARIEKDE
jgi:mannose-6-phosphate isomerase-like protein (cupin superfamily)